MPEEQKEGDFSQTEQSNEIRNYITDGLNKGYSPREIKDFLVNQGVDKHIIDVAFEGFSSEAGWGKWIASFFVLTAVFLIAIIIGSLIWYGLGGHEVISKYLGSNFDNSSGVERGESAPEIVNATPIISSAVSEGNATKCLMEFPEGPGRTLCNIQVYSSLGNQTYCESLANDKNYYTININGEGTLVSSVDMCWSEFSVKSGMDNCDKISDSIIKESCKSRLGGTG